MRLISNGVVYSGSAKRLQQHLYMGLIPTVKGDGTRVASQHCRLSTAVRASPTTENVPFC